MATRIAVDVGGTFTDVVGFDDESGQVYVGKGPTTPASQEVGVTEVVSSVLPPELVGSARFFLHGNTVGINAILERRGASVGLIATRGFRDLLETRRGERMSTYDPTWKPAQPLVPRRLRRPITERIAADGQILVELDEADVLGAVETFLEADVDCIAVALINAYANPVHELAVEHIVRGAGFSGDISLSHRVSGEYREYERTSTTVIDAYVRPHISHYLARLTDRLRALAFNGECLLTRSGGGSLTFAQAVDRPFETIMSGPVAGVVGASARCRTHGLSSAITVDVGGTSSDIAMILEGEPLLHHEGSIDGMPIQAPWVDVRSIGAGGGSIAFVGAAQLLRVGPRSAGAEPGPACYGRGGTQPTVTDAAVWLGMLGHGRLPGTLDLDQDRAAAALDRLVEQLTIDREHVARGVIEIAATHMANAIRRMSLERGEDTRTATLIAFGGMGPLFSTLLASELEIADVLIPAHAGNFSAFGLLDQDLSQSAARTFVAQLSPTALKEAELSLRSLALGLVSDGENVRAEAALDLRFAGQEHSLTIPVSFMDQRLGDSAEDVRARFTTLYERTYGHPREGDVQIAAVRLTARTPLPRLTARASVATDGSALAGSAVEAYSFALGRRVAFSVLDRLALAPGAQVEGPVIIAERTATTYVDVGFVAESDDRRDLWVRDRRGVT